MAETEREFLESVQMTPIKQGEILAQLILDLINQKALPGDYCTKRDIDLSILEEKFEPKSNLVGAKPKLNKYLCIAKYKDVEQGWQLEMSGDQKNYTDNRQRVLVSKAEVEANVPKYFVAVVEEKRKPLTADGLFG